MNKFRFDIQKNNLSWEKSVFKKCDSEKCNKKGEYRAPKSRIMLNQYFYFCLKHIKEYNKSWDFYKGMSVDQIETSMRNDTVWDRPSWPLKHNLLDETLTIEDTKALNDLDLEMPISLEKIKKNYKKLVKIFHPDVNGNNKKAEEKFKQINESYKLLLKKFIIKNGK